MKTGRWIILLVLCALAALPGCFATPPSVGPNLNVPYVPQSPNTLPFGLNPSAREIPVLPDEMAIPTDGSDTGGGNTGPVPDSVIQSHAGAFSVDLPVTVGVVEPETQAVFPPRVGPFSAPLPTLALEGERPVLDDGSVIFGVYLSTGTTPGTYTFFAEQGTTRLETTVTVIQP